VVLTRVVSMKAKTHDDLALPLSHFFAITLSLTGSGAGGTTFVDAISNGATATLALSVNTGAGITTLSSADAVVAVYDSMNTTDRTSAVSAPSRSTVRASTGPPSPSPPAPPSLACWSHPACCAAAGIEKPSRSSSSPIFVKG